MKPRAFRIACVLVFGAAAVGRAADVDVIDWALGASVTDSSASTIQRDLEGSDTPQNPYMHTMSASTSPEDTAVGAFDVSWLNDSGEFHLAVAHHLHGPRRRASNSAAVYLATDTDIVLSPSGSINFASSPGDEADFACGLSIERFDMDPALLLYFDQSIGGDLHFGTPASGSLSLQSGDILLPAGSTYRLEIGLVSETYSWPDQDPISAIGDLNFSWHAVPEPASALLIGMAMLAGFGRRRRRPL